MCKHQRPVTLEILTAKISGVHAVVASAHMAISHRLQHSKRSGIGSFVRGGIQPRAAGAQREKQWLNALSSAAAVGGRLRRIVRSRQPLLHGYIPFPDAFYGLVADFLAN